MNWSLVPEAAKPVTGVSDPRFKGYYDAALSISTSKERIPYGSIRQGQVCAAIGTPFGRARTAQVSGLSSERQRQ